MLLGVGLASGVLAFLGSPSSNAPLLPPAEKPPTVAFVNVTVVPMTGEQLWRGQTVVIRDSRISEIGSAASVKVPGDALRIDGSGKYLMPGLTDAHFHLQGNDTDDLPLLQILVANGVTSILNLYGTQSMLDLRERVARGQVPGPTIYTSGPYVSDAPHSQPEADDVERMVVEQKRAGYDLIKTHGDFSRAAFHRLFVVARRERIKVIGHAPRNLGVEPLFEERMDAIAHAEEFIYAYFFFDAPPGMGEADPDTRRRFLEDAEKRIPGLATATAKAGTWVVPNLVAYKMIVQQGTDLASVLAPSGDQVRAAAYCRRLATRAQPLRPPVPAGNGRAHDVAAGPAFKAHCRLSPGRCADDGRHGCAHPRCRAGLFAPRRAAAARRGRADAL